MEELIWVPVNSVRLNDGTVILGMAITPLGAPVFCDELGRYWGVGDVGLRPEPERRRTPWSDIPPPWEQH